MCLAGRKEIIASVRAKNAPADLSLYEFIFPYLQEVTYVMIDLLGFAPRVFTRSDDIPLLRFLANSESGLALLPTIGVMDDAETDQIDTIPVAELGALSINGYYSKIGPYRAMAESLLDAIKDFSGETESMRSPLLTQFLSDSIGRCHPLLCG